MKVEAPLFHQGIAEFNHGEFYECHETLEEYWQTLPVDLPHRQMVQGIIQIAVGFYHLGRNNVKGAVKLFTRGNQRLQAFLPTDAGLELSLCDQCVRHNLELLAAGCPFDDPRLQIPTIQNNSAP
jgi:predicted metal-dependent hydrolase